MGDVIDWTERRGKMERGARRMPGGAEIAPMGQLLFFTGVRYERTVDPFAPGEAPAESGKSSRPRRRKRRG